MIQTREQLAATLRDMAARVEKGDSFQGHISYDMMEGGLNRGEVEVSGVYRIGNTDGQGGTVMMEATPRNPESGDLIR